MSEYFLCPAGRQLFNEVNQQFPNRDKASDGWIGDPSHAARKSEHNPCWTCSGRNLGIVLAVDIDIDDRDPSRDMRRELLNILIGDPRVWYVISNGVIYSRTYGFRARAYTGSNPHTKHVHVSFRIENAWDTRPYFKPERPVRTQPYLLDISKVNAEFLRVVKGARPRYSIDVRRMQRLLNERVGAGLKVDGLVGEKTLNAEAKLERMFGGTGRPRVPDAKVLRAANKGMFRLVV